MSNIFAQVEKIIVNIKMLLININYPFLLVYCIYEPQKRDLKFSLNQFFFL
jgi:hypothetical protein